jgi:hypothetical protein
VSAPSPHDPRLRRLWAEIADTEWQLVECEFQNAAMRGLVQPPAVLGTDGVAAAQRAESRRVSLATPFDLNYWMMTFRATEAELRAAVARVGTSVAEVRRQLGK